MARLGGPAYKLRMEINLRIRQLRQERHLTLEQLAAKAGMSAGQLSQLERGTRNLNNPTIERLARALGVKPSDLIAEEPLSEVERLSRAMAQLSPEDRARVEAFAIALLRSQQGPQQS